MGILDAHSDDLIQTSRNSRIQPLPVAPAEPGMFHNFGSSAGNFFMRGMAEAGRSLSMAAAAVPVALDKVVGSDNMSGSSLADQYFAFHDETFGKAVEHWTPKPSEVGAAGQVVGSLGAGVLQFLASPALAVANAQLSTSEELVRQGVDAGPALVAGDIAGLGTVAGIALPIVGKSLAQRVATGVAGNLGQGIAQAGATQAVLKAANAAHGVVAQYDPFDARNRTVDALMGVAFGAKTHMDSRLSQTQRDAITLVNQARHIEQASMPGRAAGDVELTRAVENTKTAMDQMLRGEPVSVEDVAPARITPAERDANFKAWFGESQATKWGNNSPAVKYHGTAQDVPAFDLTRAGSRDDGDFGAAIYVSDKPETASRYATHTGTDPTLGSSAARDAGGNVMPVYIKAERPLVLYTSDDFNALWKKAGGEEAWFDRTPQQQAEFIQSLGYDSVWDKKYGQWAVFNPEQIKSATGNSGRFDPTSASLTDPLQNFADALDQVRRATTQEPARAPTAPQATSPEAAAPARGAGDAPAPAAAAEPGRSGASVEADGVARFGLTPDDARAIVEDEDAGAIPAGWFVHGRADSKSKLSANWVIQMTTDPRVAVGYAGDRGSVWALKPNERTSAADFTATDTADMDSFVGSLRAAFDDQKDDSNTSIGAVVSDIENNRSGGAVEFDEFEAKVRDEFTPVRIVDTAGAFDSDQWIALLEHYPSGWPDMVRTPDGAVVLPGAAGQMDVVNLTALAESKDAAPVEAPSGRAAGGPAGAADEAVTERGLTDPIKDAQRAETARIVGENTPPADPVTASSKQMTPPDRPGAMFPDDLMIPHPDTEAPMRANDLIQEARADAARLKTNAENFMVTAANCLLGTI